MDFLTANDRQGEYPRSYYADTAQTLSRFPRANGALECDVCVVGAGFTGLSTAYHLAQRGYDVIVLDAQRVGFGASGRNGGQVSMGQRIEQDALEKMLGLDQARALWDIGAQAVGLVRELAQKDEVKTDFHDGVIHTIHRPRYQRYVEDYVKTLSENYGYDKIRVLDKEECRHL
ncbi:MAG: FAD-binding oxidoreductase, partial [Pseudomonadota bacterium]